MSYQIKSTPYFRRIVNNSKKNGQLQRLREEYERIQEFNDRTIELKMRQVRLKRLFREIEEIKEATAGVAPSTSTAAAQAAAVRLQRLEALARAKELGKEISRRNAEVADPACVSFRGEQRVTAKMQAAANAQREAIERRERAAKRISYGNAQSKHNMERLLQRLQRRQKGEAVVSASASTTTADSLQLTSTAVAFNSPSDLTKRARLEQRLLYGNSRSCGNMLRNFTLLEPTEPEQPDSDQDMQTAPLAPSSYPAITISAHQPSLAVPAPRSRASAHWHQISLTLPWFRAFPNRRPSMATSSYHDVATMPSAAYHFQDNWPQRVCSGFRPNSEPEQEGGTMSGV